MNSETLYSYAEELIESWINGNREHVLSELERLSDTRVGLALCALVIDGLDSDDRNFLACCLVDRAT